MEKLIPADRKEIVKIKNSIIYCFTVKIKKAGKMISRLLKD
jgi:hypothetical protein